MPEALAWSLMAGLTTAIAVAAWLATSRSRLRAQAAQHVVALRTRDEELRHLATTGLSALAEEVTEGRTPTYRWLHPDLADTTFGVGLQKLVDAASGTLAAERRRARQMTQSTLLSVARSLQGGLNGQQMAITDMMRRHDAPEVVGDLMEIDHTTAQLLRRVQSIVVACAAWPGRQHDPTPVFDVARGAVGRVLDYQRVGIAEREGGRAVVGRVVEGLVLALAELLENATRYSAPHTTVQVQFQLAHAGISIVIDDAGVGLKPGERERAERLLSGEEPVDVTGLGNPPKFGFAVIGALAKRYGFSASVDSVSPFGGVRAVVHLPSSILTDAADTRPSTPDGPRQPAEPGRGDGSQAGVATTAHGLPMRRRHAPPAASAVAARTAAPEAPPERSAEEAAARLSAFVRSSRTSHPPTPEGTHP
jgi:signal transduction histidine kinase